MSKAELVFVPAMGMGHLVSMVEIAKLLVDRDDRLFITVLILNLPIETKVSGYIKSLEASSSISERIRFVDLPPVNDTHPDSNPIVFFVSTFYENQKPHVRDAVAKLAQSRSGPDSPRLAGFVLDVFCSTMVDVANEFGLPTYMYVTSGAGFLSLMSHLQSLADEQNFDPTEFKNDPQSEFIVPGFVNLVPTKVWPGVVLNKATAQIMVGHFRRTRQSKGILVNTFLELETHGINSFEEKYPQLYPVGPILNLNNDDDHLGLGGADIIKWLDNQPPLSVVFLCFGSMGSFNEDQVKETAIGLEQSGHRFLWSLRKPSPIGEFPAPTDYTDPSEVLPKGFLNRTAEIGKIIGWAPQVAILAHPAIGGFVSHCGWNSTLESIWFGVPIATWPLDAEQQLNAFWMVKELGLAIEIKLDYRKDYNFANSGNCTNVTAQEIESGIKSVMEVNSETRKTVKQMSDKSRKALVDGGSSYATLGRFLNDVIENTP
ncbi:hypothetical protein UlMin_014036 [Ulmus minor]